MCNHALVARPPDRFFSKNGTEVRIQGFLHADGIDEEKIARFEREKNNGKKLPRIGPWIEIERFVKVASFDGVRNEVRKLGVDITVYFNPTNLTYH